MPRIPLPALIVIAFPLALPVLMEPEKLIDPTLYVSMNEFPLLLARRLIGPNAEERTEDPRIEPV